MKIFLVFVLCFFRLFGDEAVWSSPVTISNIGKNSLMPRIAMDSMGNVVAVWIEDGVVTAKQSVVHGSWPDSAVSVSSSGVSSLEIAMDGGGNAVAIWNCNGVIQFASLPLDGIWSTPFSLSSSGSLAPQIAIDSLGNIATIWVSNGIVQSSVKSVNGIWPLLPTNLSAALTVSDSPQIAIDQNGLIVAVWRQADTIYAASRTLAGSWSVPVAISDSGYLNANPQIAVNPKGGATAAWYRYKRSGTNYSQVVVQTAFLSKTGSWGTPVDVSGLGEWNPSQLVLRLHYNSIGIPILMWNNSYDRVNFDIEFSVYVQGQWTQSGCLTRLNRYAYDLDFTVSNTGYAFGAYMLRDPSLDIPVIQTLISNTYASLVNFGDQETITFMGASGYPRISGTSSVMTKDVGAVWLYSDGGNNVVQSAWGMGEISAAPTNLAVVKQMQDWGIFQEYYSTITWDYPSSDSCIGFFIFRNNALIGSVPSSVFTFTDWNCPASGSIVYGVASLEMDGDQSPTATINVP